MASGEKKRRKLWKEEDMVAALEAVKSNALTVTQAATTHNVPRKTLDNQVKGQVVHGTNPERDTVDYVLMMKEKDRQEKEAEELKKKRKEEREEKKRERERQNRERRRKTEAEEGK